MTDDEVARDYPVVLTEWCSRCQRPFTDGDWQTAVIAAQPPFGEETRGGL